MEELPDSSLLSATRMIISSRAHIAGLKRLSERANSTALSAATNLSQPSSSSCCSSSSCSSASLCSSSSATSPRKISFSFAGYGRGVIEQLRSLGVRIDPGLSDEEVERIQATFQLTFPPDLRGVLQQGLPQGPGFPDWRAHLINPHKLRLWIAMPKSGLCSDTELGLFWWKPWGPRPTDINQAVQSARAALRKVPVLIPVFAQCFVPAAPIRAGNPVLFVEQSEAVYCARELSEFFAKDCFRSFIVNGGGTGTYTPEPILCLNHHHHHHHQDSRCNLDSTRRMIARCASNIGEEQLEESSSSSSASWGRNLDALADHRRSSVSARSVLAGPRASSAGSRSSNGSSSSSSSSDEGPIQDLAAAARIHHHHHHTGGNQSVRGVRRIEFWSDLVEKRHTLNAAGRRCIDSSDLLHLDLDLDLDEQIQQQQHDDNAWNVVKEGLEGMADKLRSAGWAEKDVSEILSCFSSDSSDSPKPSSSSSSSSSANRNDRRSVLEGLAAQLDSLSGCLRDAGWSVRDVSETLSCFDLTGFSDHPRSRARLTISPEVASRIGVLAAFVAQG